MNKLIFLLFTNPDKSFSVSLLFTITSAVFTSVFLLLVINKLPSRLPLFYSLPWGEQQLIPAQQLFLLPILMILVLVLNFSISSQLHNSQIILKRMLVLNTVVINAILLITILKVVTIFI